jgi:hypothetical protein
MRSKDYGARKGARGAKKIAKVGLGRISCSRSIDETGERRKAYSHWTVAHGINLVSGCTARKDFSQRREDAKYTQRQPELGWLFDATGSMRCLRWIAMFMVCGTALGQQPAAPDSVGIVLDTSGSMGAKLGRSRQVASQFLKTAEVQDEFFLIEANDHPVLASAFTTNTYSIQDHLVFVQSKGRSALWDAVYLALSEIKKGQSPHKALVVLSDGGDNRSRYTPDDMTRLVREAGVPIYAFGVYEPAASRVRTAEELEGPLRLKEIAEQSGGRYFTVENINDIPGFAASVSSEVRSAGPRTVR